MEYWNENFWIKFSLCMHYGLQQICLFEEPYCMINSSRQMDEIYKHSHFMLQILLYLEESKCSRDFSYTEVKCFLNTFFSTFSSFFIIFFWFLIFFMLCFQNLRDYKAPNKRDFRTLSDIYTGAFLRKRSTDMSQYLFSQKSSITDVWKALNVLILKSILNLK